MRRGELRRYVRPSTPDQQRTVVLLSSDGINDSPRPWLLGIELRDRDPADILAIPIPGHGWAYAGDLTKLYRAWNSLGQQDEHPNTRGDTGDRPPARRSAGLHHDNTASGAVGSAPDL